MSKFFNELDSIWWTMDGDLSACLSFISSLIFRVYSLVFSSFSSSCAVRATAAATQFPFSQRCFLSSNLSTWEVR